MRGLRLVGFTAAGTPVYSVMGGAPEGEDEGDSDAGEGGGSADDPAPEGEADDYVPPSKEEFRRMADALKKANGEAAQRRRWLDENGIDPRTGQRYDAEEDEEPQPRTQARPTAPAKKAATAAEEDTAEEDVKAGRQISEADLAKLERERRIEGKRAAQREATLTRALTKKATAAALSEAGWNGKGASIIERMIDLTDVEVDDEGEIIGLAEQIAEVKTEMPEWFKKARAASTRAANGSGAREVDGADKSGGTKVKPKDNNGWLSKISEQIDGVE